MHFWMLLQVRRFVDPAVPFGRVLDAFLDASAGSPFRGPGRPFWTGFGCIFGCFCRFAVSWTRPSLLDGFWMHFWMLLQVRRFVDPAVRFGRVLDAFLDAFAGSPFRGPGRPFWTGFGCIF